jgi:hypothetical protein
MSKRWVPVIDYEDQYEVSELGEIRAKEKLTCYGRHLKPKLIKPAPNHNGYLIVVLCKDKNRKTRVLHRIIKESFHGKSDLTVDHIDGNRKNNKLSNLEYTTHTENCYRRSLKKNNLVGIRKRGNSWTARIMIDSIQYHLGSFKTKEEALEKYMNARGKK